MEEKCDKEEGRRFIVGECCILNPVSWKIVRLLRESESGMHTGQLAKIIGEDKRYVAFHIIELQQHDFVTSEFGVIEPVGSRHPEKGKVGNIFELTEKGVMAYDAIREVLPALIESEYKTLEQQILELWKRRGMQVLEETFEKLEEEKLKWTIIARRKEEGL